MAVLPLVLLISAASAELTIMPLWQDGMVLQCSDDAGPPTLVWGLGATPAQKIELTSDGGKLPGEPFSAHVDEETGLWALAASVPASAVGVKLTITVDGLAAFTAEGVLFGDVFVCGGQSNMELPVQRVDTGAEIIAAADKISGVRLFANYGGGEYPSQGWPVESKIPASVRWVKANSTTVAAFSAVCWLTATEVRRARANSTLISGIDNSTVPQLAVAPRPLGLIQSAMGGTPIEGWCPDEALIRCKISPALPIPSQEGAWDPVAKAVNVTAVPWERAGTLFRQMMQPLVGTAARSILWYQGEANMNEGYHLGYSNYGCVFGEMISEWRTLWGVVHDLAVGGPADRVLPFNAVQLSSCDVGNDGQVFDSFANYGDIRTAQAEVARRLPFVGLSVSFDQGYASIHSPHKPEMAHRLALKVLANSYDDESERTHFASFGPVLRGACVATPPSEVGGTNLTVVRLILANADALAFRNTSECETQSPSCCTMPPEWPLKAGVAPGVVQVSVGDVWVGEDWLDAGMEIEAGTGNLLLHVPLGSHRSWDPFGNMTNHGWSHAVWQVRYAFGAFPSCALVNANGIPLAPFGPLAVSPACGWD